MDVEAQRRAVVEEARSWLKTPYHHLGRVKGEQGGVDCATLLVEVYARAGVIPDFDIVYYPPDWFLHRSAERYLHYVTERAVEIPGPPQPGDVVLFKFGRCFAHGGIVLDWPTIIHAYVNRNVTVDNVLQCSFLTHVGEPGKDRGKPRPRHYFTPLPWIGQTPVELLRA
jgi:cell wall-associated NlpC family hydrolase